MFVLLTSLNQERNVSVVIIDVPFLQCLEKVYLSSYISLTGMECTSPRNRCTYTILSFKRQVHDHFGMVWFAFLCLWRIIQQLQLLNAATLRL